ISNIYYVFLIGVVWDTCKTFSNLIWCFCCTKSSFITSNPFFTFKSNKTKRTVCNYFYIMYLFILNNLIYPFPFHISIVSTSPFEKQAYHLCYLYLLLL